MTIRDYIKRRFRTLALIFALAYATLQSLSICIRHWPEVFNAKGAAGNLRLVCHSSDDHRVPAMLSPAGRGRSSRLDRK
jgi:hypothetical protein